MKSSTKRRVLKYVKHPVTMAKYQAIGAKLVLRSFLLKIDNLPPLLNLIATAGFHGLVTAGFGLFGLAHFAAFAYCFREVDQTVTKVSRGRGGFPTGWALADSLADCLIPVAVALLFR